MSYLSMVMWQVKKKKENYLTYFHILNFNFKKKYLQIQTSAEWITEVISQAAKESQQDGI